ncbi:hypothetical protein DEO72_LG3g1634 [Vigna unguiculata]|uniref:Transposase (putative) gypsy type domain-containing protein n=1 Tax=Vigna unguiculata TaxID=3917 RepID=A0A4D6LES7_VIGUN|nr:hypothetical protein DEO72_LG3g1634 [Vigna unguiculata]
MPMGLVRSGTPIPQPLSVMNNVKANGGKGFMAEKKDMSSSDSVSLSSSSSESIESGGSIGRHVEEESTSSVGMVGRIPMETVIELHVRLSLDDFTMGVLRALNIAPTQLDPNSWAYMQAFRVLCRSLYLQPSPYAFLYFYDTRPRQPTTWLSLDMGTDELSAVDKEVVEVLTKFTDKFPTKGLVRVYNSMHLIIDIEALRKEMATKANSARNTYVPNLPESLVEVHMHSRTKRKAELPARPSKGKNVKKVRAALLGAGSVSGTKGREFGLIELSEISVRKDIATNLPNTIIKSIDVIVLGLCTDEK